MFETDGSNLPSQLMDIYQPESVSWWPLAPGWWILLVLLLLSVIFLSRYYYQKTALRRVSLVELSVIEADYQRNGNINQLAMDLNLFLRRILISKPKLDLMPGIVDQKWLEYLDSLWDKKEFSCGIGQRLLDLPYQKRSDERINSSQLGQELIALIRAWVRKVA